MGVLTALYYVKYPIFDRMAAEDRLDKLVAVLHGYQPPRKLAFPKGMPPRCVPSINPGRIFAMPCGELTGRCCIKTCRNTCK